MRRWTGSAWYPLHMVFQNGRGERGWRGWMRPSISGFIHNVAVTRWGRETKRACSKNSKRMRNSEIFMNGNRSSDRNGEWKRGRERGRNRFREGRNMGNIWRRLLSVSSTVMRQTGGCLTVWRPVIHGMMNANCKPLLDSQAQLCNVGNAQSEICLTP